ncbi:cytoplasmic FMR1-interacting protein 1-like [Tubulanus polymorphus]|uniref:cytoplasmic FMR1-interacting protein 1-like n=1 Tax=Tubulanus polymorphus TaxID=672921 RepID=UPI003DA47CF5
MDDNNGVVLCKVERKSSMLTVPPSDDDNPYAVPAAIPVPYNPNLPPPPPNPPSYAEPTISTSTHHIPAAGEEEDDEDLPPPPIDLPPAIPPPLTMAYATVDLIAGAPTIAKEPQADYFISDVTITDTFTEAVSAEGDETDSEESEKKSDEGGDVPPSQQQMRSNRAVSIFTTLTDRTAPEDEEQALNPEFWRPLPQLEPFIEAPSISIHHVVDTNTHFEDKCAFVTTQAKFIEEASKLAELEDLIDEGNEYTVLLYTWRSCSLALPKRQKENPKPEYYKETLALIKPKIEKLRKFYQYQQRAIEYLCNDIKMIRLCQMNKKMENDFVSLSHLLKLGKMLSMLAVLDALKDVKTSVTNDNATIYRRAVQFLRRNPDFTEDPNVLETDNIMTLWLATKKEIGNNLKKKLIEIPGFEKILAEIIKTCVHMYEDHKYLIPEEKYTLVKAIGFCISLLSGAVISEKKNLKEANIYKMDSKKKINLSKIDKIFKELEAVPLYGDMQIAPFMYVDQNDVNYDESKWPLCSAGTSGSQCHLVEALPKIREDHLKYVGELVRLNLGDLKEETEKVKMDAQNRKIYDIGIRGLQLISSWSCRLMEMYSWKLFHPTDHHDNAKCPTDAEEYERATRYNYSDNEKQAMIELIAMIKGLQSKLHEHLAVFNQATKAAIFAELQDFVQLTLRDPLRKAVKGKKELLTRIMTSIKATVEQGNLAMEGDFALKGKSDPKGFVIDVPRKTVAPSTSQIYLLRTMVEALVNMGKGKTNHRKDIDSSSIVAMERFHSSCFFWEYMINFNESLQVCCQLGQFWYREIFLEMTRGRRVQFPIEMSMPWILADHVMKDMHPTMCECILYILDLYNDSANYALTVFKEQHLFDEVEAEVLLCFEQLVGKITSQVYSYYKQKAGGMLLERCFKEENYEEKRSRKNKKKKFKNKSIRFHSILKQRHFQLLGRSIDFKLLIGSRITEELKTSLDCAIKRFEAADITAVVELEGLIEVNRLAHHLMKQHLILPDFDALLKESDQNIHSPYGRIALHAFWEINYDFLPNYCYRMTTNRFIRTVHSFSEEEVEREHFTVNKSQHLWGSKPLRRGYFAKYSGFSSFVGAPHIQALCRLVGHIGVSLLVGEVVNVLKSMLDTRGSIKQQLFTLRKGMPDSLKLHRLEYMASGILSYFYASVKDILQHPELTQVVLHTLREFGNAIVFCMMVNDCLLSENVNEFKHSMMFQHLIPKPLVTKNRAAEIKDYEERLNKLMKKREQRYKPYHITETFKTKASTQQSDEIELVMELLQSLPRNKGSMLPSILSRLQKTMLADTEQTWTGAPPSNQVLETEKADEFHRVWSVVQFSFSIPKKNTEMTVEELFGEGLQWAGCTLIYLLGQHRRFEMLDLCYHAVKAFQPDRESGLGNVGIDLNRMMNRIKSYRCLNRQIFHILEKSLTDSQGLVTDRISSNGVKIIHFDPPEFTVTKQRPESSTSGAAMRRECWSRADSQTFSFNEDEFEDDEDTAPPSDSRASVLSLSGHVAESDEQHYL